MNRLLTSPLALIALLVGAGLELACSSDDEALPSDSWGLGGAPATPTPTPTTTGAAADPGLATASGPANNATQGESTVPTGGETPVGAGDLTGADSQLGTGQMSGSGSSDNRWNKADVSRNGVNYFLMANGWGPGFQSQAISWNGTSFTVDSMEGSQGDNWEPASYPTVFCGTYSDSESGPCGLPAAIDSLSSLRTGWSWQPNGNTGQYNAAYDIWLGNGESIGDFSGYLMVWYREPPGQQPAGTRKERGVSVANVPGVWDLWAGTVNNHPIINWVRPEGEDTLAMEFDVLDFVRDAQARGLQVPGTHILSVAVGFEIWNGPIANLETVDFFVEPK